MVEKEPHNLPIQRIIKRKKKKGYPKAISGNTNKVVYLFADFRAKLLARTDWDGESQWDFFSEKETSKTETPARSEKESAVSIFLAGVQPLQLSEILQVQTIFGLRRLLLQSQVLGLEERISVTPYLKRANAVLATQTELKQGAWVT